MFFTNCDCQNILKCSHSAAKWECVFLLFFPLFLMIVALSSFFISHAKLIFVGENGENIERFFQIYHRHDLEGLDMVMVGQIGDYDMITVFSYIFSARKYKMFLISIYWVLACSFSLNSSSFYTCVLNNSSVCTWCWHGGPKNGRELPKKYSFMSKSYISYLHCCFISYIILCTIGLDHGDGLESIFVTFAILYDFLASELK